MFILLIEELLHIATVLLEQLRQLRVFLLHHLQIQLQVRRRLLLLYLLVADSDTRPAACPHVGCMRGS